MGGVLLSIFMVALFWHYYLQAISPPDDLFKIEKIAFQAENNAEKQLRILPDDWRDSSPDISKGWYFATLSRIDQNKYDLWAIYLPVVQMNARIFVNNELIGRIGDLEKKIQYSDSFSRVAPRPYYFPIPTVLLDHNKNELKIQVMSAAAGNGLLGKIYLGEAERLHTVYDKRKSILVTSVGTITAGMLAIAILMTVLWALRRQDSVYGWYALTLYIWSLHNFFKMGISLPISQHAQNIISALALGWFIVFMVKAVHHYLKQKFVVRETAMLIAACIGSFMIVFAKNLPWSELTTHQIWSTYVITLAAYVLLDFSMKYLARSDLHSPFIIMAGFSILIFGTHDWLLIMQFIPRGMGRLLHFSAPIAVATFGVLLLEQFASVLRKAESHNLVLEHRVAEKHKELETNYQRMREMENKQLLIDERERFMKEIHDGVGGHLISMLSMVRSGQQDTELIVKSIDATLSDLRMMIYSFSPHENDIPSLLGELRTRLEPQLENSGLQLHWQVEALPEIPNFGSHKALQVLRIVQEAVTNIIRHADAKNISIKAYTSPKNESNLVMIEICDDGRGFSEQQKHGNGMDNMQYRAKEIEAEMDISSTEKGTCIILRF